MPRASLTHRVMFLVAWMFFLALVPAAASAQTAWTATSPYPSGGKGNSCVVASGYVYCVGGTVDNKTWYAPISSLGLVGIPVL